jgi:hypothetical protein
MQIGRFYGDETRNKQLVETRWSREEAADGLRADMGLLLSHAIRLLLVCAGGGRGAASCVGWLRSDV